VRVNARLLLELANALESLGCTFEGSREKCVVPLPSLELGGEGSGGGEDAGLENSWKGESVLKRQTGRAGEEVGTDHAMAVEAGRQMLVKEMEDCARAANSPSSNEQALSPRDWPNKRHNVLDCDQERSVGAE
jgi:hypothetical protein